MAAEDDRLGRDLSSAEFNAYVEQGFWKVVERDENILYVLLCAPDERSFLARLDCSEYWDEPIHGTFVDLENRQSVPAAWPDGNTHFEQWIKFKSSPGFICWDQDREGLRHHLEWKTRKSWQKKPNQLVAYLDFLRQMIHVPALGYNRQKLNTNV
jgi:hypothetical protein